jgi:hypothetical protein
MAAGEKILQLKKRFIQAINKKKFPLIVIN